MTLEEDLAYFNSVSSELARENKGKFVLIKDGKAHGIFSSFSDAHTDALKKFGLTEVLIMQIGVEPPINYLASIVR